MDLFLAILALLGNCGWFISGRKYRQEVRRAKAEASQEEFDLSARYVKEFKENIYDPLQEEVRKLRTAIEAVSACPHRDDCPVLDRMHDQSNAPPLPSRHRDNHD